MAEDAIWLPRSDSTEERICFVNFQSLKKRFKRRLRYSVHDPLDRLSFPLTEAASDYFDKQAPFDYLPLDFAANLSREACVHPCAFVMALIYLERLRASDADHFNCSDPAELYVTALLLASKFVMDDGLVEYVYNDEWASSSNMDLKRINKLEIEFLKKIDWNLGLKWPAFQKMLQQIETKVAVSSMDRGYCMTYSDLLVIYGSLAHFQSFSTILANLLRPIIQAFAVVMIGVAATLVSLGTLSLAVYHSFSTMPAISDIRYQPSTGPLSLVHDQVAGCVCPDHDAIPPLQRQSELALQLDSDNPQNLEWLHRSYPSGNVGSGWDSRICAGNHGWLAKGSYQPNPWSAECVLMFDGVFGMYHRKVPLPASAGGVNIRKRHCAYPNLLTPKHQSSGKLPTRRQCDVEVPPGFEDLHPYLLGEEASWCSSCRKMVHGGFDCKSAHQSSPSREVIGLGRGSSVWVRIKDTFIWLIGTCVRNRLLMNYNEILGKQKHLMDSEKYHVIVGSDEPYPLLNDTGAMVELFDFDVEHRSYG